MKQIQTNKFLTIEMIPGEIITPSGTIKLNADRQTLELEVANTDDRPL